MLTRGRVRGLSLTEVVVLAAVLSLLMVGVILFLRPARSTAFRMTCGVNLASLGKAMFVYANDYEDLYPSAGGESSKWGALGSRWMASDRSGAYNMSLDGEGGEASISSCLYLLVKYTEVTPETFVCEQDRGVSAFDLARVRSRPKGSALTDAWDFGPQPSKHVSYAYQMVLGEQRLSMTAPPDVALAADRNPWIVSPRGKIGDFSKFQPDIAPFSGTTETALSGNAAAHQGDGQNVLFNDSHVEFAKRSYCGRDDDNIYTSWKGADRARGIVAKFGSVPADPNDSLLVNDPPVATQAR